MGSLQAVPGLGTLLPHQLLSSVGSYYPSFSLLSGKEANRAPTGSCRRTYWVLGPEQQKMQAWVGT